jgi:hypothetical protein
MADSLTSERDHDFYINRKTAPPGFHPGTPYMTPRQALQENTHILRPEVVRYLHARQRRQSRLTSQSAGAPSDVRNRVSKANTQGRPPTRRGLIGGSTEGGRSGHHSETLSKSATVTDVEDDEGRTVSNDDYDPTASPSCEGQDITKIDDTFTIWVTEHQHYPRTVTTGDGMGMDQDNMNHINGASINAPAPTPVIETIEDDELKDERFATSTLLNALLDDTACVDGDGPAATDNSDHPMA